MSILIAALFHLLPAPQVPITDAQLAQGPLPQARAHPTASGVTYMVAASNATVAERLAASIVCDGTADQLEIQAGLDSLMGHGGIVHLSSGTFEVDAPVRLRGKISLRGTGAGTVVQATPSFTSGEGILDGFYAGTGDPLNFATVTSMTLDGNRFQGANSAGVHVDVRSSSGFEYGSPDAQMKLTDLLITRTTGHGVHLEGSSNRAARVTRVRVWNCDGIGYLIASPDGSYVDCETGSSGSHGFQVTSANNYLTACKAWYSDGDGFRIAAVRSILTGCTAQDNEENGFYLGGGMTSLTGCHADSNSFKHTGANPDPNQGLFDGFHIAANNVTISGSFAYEKNEGGRGRNQRYGTYIAGNMQRLNLQVSAGNGAGGAGSGTHNNHTGGIGGTLTGAGNRIVATGQTDYITP